ncbi:MAG: hypothetical protein IID46_11855, partial [Planctomycetes bacterium]|nr:hypothetical protein [Planctomycetota bacterium]
MISILHKRTEVRALLGNLESSGFVFNLYAFFHTNSGSKTIKGPGSRIDLDVRRLWKCPQCGSRAKTDGTTVSRQCFCLKNGVWMTLVEERPPKKEYQPRPADDVVEPQTEAVAEPVDVTAESSAAETDSAQPEISDTQLDPLTEEMPAEQTETEQP